jgi:hypothetical protein
VVLPLGAAPACVALLALTSFACSEPSAARDAESDAATSPDASAPCTSTFVVSPDCKHPPVQAKGQPD